jgi:hypothetical protein
LGYGLKTLMDRRPPDCLFIFVEPDPRLRELEPGEGRAAPLLAGREELEAWLQAQDFSRIRRAELLPLSHGYSLEAPRYRFFLDLARSYLNRYWKNRAVLVQLGPLWIKNLFKNLSRLPSGASPARLKTELPVFTAGAGESLEDLLPELRTHRRRFFLLGVDTALGALLDGGLVPDAVIALEAQHINLLDFLGLEGRKIPLLCDLTSAPALLNHYPGEKYFYLTPFADLAVFKELSQAGIRLLTLPPLGSVGLSALAAALYLSGGPVFFAGLDFAFAPGKTHARSSPALLSRLATCRRTGGLEDLAPGFDPPLRRVQGKDGAALLSSPNLLDYRAYLSFLNGGGRLFDLGRRGLPLAIPRFAGLEEALTKTAGLVFSGAPGPPEPPEIRAGRVGAFLAAQDQALGELLQTGRRWLAGERGGEAEGELRGRLKALDYLTCTFADDPPGEEGPLGESYVKRALAWAGYIRGVIKNFPV